MAHVHINHARNVQVQIINASEYLSGLFMLLLITFQLVPEWSGARTCVTDLICRVRCVVTSKENVIILQDKQQRKKPATFADDQPLTNGITQRPPPPFLVPCINEHRKIAANTFCRQPKEIPMNTKPRGRKRVYTIFSQSAAWFFIFHGFCFISSHLIPSRAGYSD